MSGHTITWTVDDGQILHPRVMCTEPETADCRQHGGDDCECEQWTIEHDDQGPFHTVTEYHDDDTEAEVKHRMVSGSCHVAAWLENSDEVELDATATFDVVVPFEPVWAGDFYQWKPLVKVVGAAAEPSAWMVARPVKAVRPQVGLVRVDQVVNDWDGTAYQAREIAESELANANKDRGASTAAGSGEYRLYAVTEASGG